MEQDVLKEMPSSIKCFVASHRSAFLSYPMADDLQYGVRLRVYESGPLQPLALTQKVSKSDLP